MSIFRACLRRELRLGVLLLLIFMVIFLLAPLRTAHALSAVADGTDPYTDGCAGGSASWYVVKSAYIYDDVSQLVGYAQLWYSATCNTNWARVVPYSAVNGLTIRLEAWNGSSWQTKQGPLSCSSYCWDTRTGSYDLRTGQYAIPGPAAAMGCVIEPSGRGGCATAAQST